jgi:hypothetical protein
MARTDLTLKKKNILERIHSFEDALGLIAFVVLAPGLALSCDDGQRSYRRALSTFGVEPSSYSAESAAVVNSVLSHAPIGSSRVRVVGLLDSLGFAPSADLFDETRPAFHVDSARGTNAIWAHQPYEDPFLSLDRFVCDRPALRLFFRFDTAWRLVAVDATTARACI